MREYGEISEYFRQNIEKTYLESIKNKILEAKTRYLQSIDGQEGYDNILMVINKNETPRDIKDRNYAAERVKQEKGTIRTAASNDNSIKDLTQGGRKSRRTIDYNLTENDQELSKRQMDLMNLSDDLEDEDV